jgi:UPF0716 protein FxsA
MEDRRSEDERNWTLVRLLLLFTLVPLIELALLLELARHISWPTTLLIVLATGAIGAALARRQGWQTMQTIQHEMAAGRLPTQALTDGAMILVAGCLLVTPGVLTDAVGFSLLVPAMRRRFKRVLMKFFEQRMVIIRKTSVQTANGERFVDVTATSVGPGGSPQQTHTTYTEYGTTEPGSLDGPGSEIVDVEATVVDAPKQLD